MGHFLKTFLILRRKEQRPGGLIVLSVIHGVLPCSAYSDIGWVIKGQQSILFFGEKSIILVQKKITLIFSSNIVQRLDQIV